MQQFSSYRFKLKYTRLALQVLLMVVGILMILHGFFGPTLAPKNLATTLSWVHFRGLLVLLILAAGNFFCFSCPLTLVRDVVRRFINPRWNWPQRLRNKWISIALFISVLFVYELFDLWGSPIWTAMLILSFFISILIIDGLFKHATFCKFVCPIGQFNFIASTISPLEVTVRNRSICTDCKTKDCIRGVRDEENKLRVIQRGCELALFQPLKTGNMDCTFCMDCIQACPHDNVDITSRVPAMELLTDPPRSGIGYFSRRKDLAALVSVFTFGATLNAFGMVAPIYSLQYKILKVLNLNHEAPALGLIFLLFLIIAPVMLLGMTSILSRRLGRMKTSVMSIAIKYVFGLVPLGFGIWISHYSFHFLTGIFTFIPVFQSAAINAGLPILGEPAWHLVGVPLHVAYPIEIGFLGLGLAGSLLVFFKLVEGDTAVTKKFAAFIPWACLAILLWAVGMWLMSQPMEMRGTLIGT